MVLYNKHCSSRSEKFQSSVTAAATFARQMSLISLNHQATDELNKS